MAYYSTSYVHETQCQAPPRHGQRFREGKVLRDIHNTPYEHHLDVTLELKHMLLNAKSTQAFPFHFEFTLYSTATRAHLTTRAPYSAVISFLEPLSPSKSKETAQYLTWQLYIVEKHSPRGYYTGVLPIYGSNCFLMILLRCQVKFL
jgi:hypothetical protein